MAWQDQMLEYPLIHTSHPRARVLSSSLIFLGPFCYACLPELWGYLIYSLFPLTYRLALHLSPTSSSQDSTSSIFKIFLISFSLYLYILTQLSPSTQATHHLISPWSLPLDCFGYKDNQKRKTRYRKRLKTISSFNSVLDYPRASSFIKSTITTLNSNTPLLTHITLSQCPCS
jgi:hypothetical protein